MADTATLTSDAPVSTDVIGSWTPDERHNWRLTGEVPGSATAVETPSAPADTNTSTEAASSPAEPDVQVASTEAVSPPDSEPGTPKKNAASRKAELAAEIQNLLSQRNALKAELESSRSRPAPPPDVPAASSPATGATLAQVVQSPDISQPPLTDAAFFERFPDANVSDFYRYAARYEVVKERTEFESAQRVEALRGKFREALTPAVQADPELWNKLPALAAVQPASLVPDGQPVGPLSHAAQEIIESPDPAKILLHLAANPALVQTLAQGTGAAAIRTIARLAVTLDTPSASTQPVVKTTTSAPAPPQTLGSRPSAPVDEAKAAIAAGDFASYRSVQNRLEGGR